MLKHTLTAAALAAVLATPAFAQAQQPTPGTSNSAAQSAPASKGSKGMTAKPDQNAANTASQQKTGEADKENNTAKADSNAAKTDQNNMAEDGAKEQPASFMQSQTAGEWRGTKLIGATVYGPDKNSIGDINDVLIDKGGRVTAVVVGVGGFLGVGEKNVALPFTALNVERKQGASAIDKITVSYTKKQLKSAPRFAYYKGGEVETTGTTPGGNANTPATPTTPGAKSQKK